MAKVIKLPQSVINQIAAGEVVENPASVVKELVENSIDANADYIEIDLKNGGIDEIIVKDNGEGISKSDLQLIFEPHTTSKLHSIEDLQKLSTLGFRGEALSSIAAVSRTIIVSKQQDQSIGYAIEVEYGKIGNIQEQPRDTGTTIKVSDLFAKIPARKKFLKNPTTELRKIITWVNKPALLYPSIELVVIHNNRKLLHYHKVDSSIRSFIHPQRAQAVIGNIFADMVPFNTKYENTQIGGYVGHPKLMEKYPKYTFIFVNGRSIWDNGLAKSVYMGLHRFIPQEYKVPFILNISIDPKYVDINIHPRKEEVRFANPYRLYAVITDTIKKSIEDEVHTNTEFSRTITEKDTMGKNAIYRLRNPSPTLQVSQPKAMYTFTPSPQQKNMLSDTNQTKVKTAYQMLNKYIIAEVEDEIWIIDQHAAAERIRFEKLLSYIQNGKPISQRLLSPIKVQGPTDSILAVQEIQDLLSQAGYHIQINSNQIIISAVPDIIKDGNHQEIIQSAIHMADHPNQAKHDIKSIKEDIIATLACHTSLRANKHITDQEAFVIINQLLNCKNPYSCPHGRPTIWKLSINEINKHFLRHT